MNPGYEAGGTYVLRVLGVIERLGPEDLCAVRRELEAARDGVTELALGLPASARVFSCLWYDAPGALSEWHLLWVDDETPRVVVVVRREVELVVSLGCGFFVAVLDVHIQDGIF